MDLEIYVASELEGSFPETPVYGPGSRNLSSV